jgi:DNA-3-methyladenine glycosylase
MIGANGVSVLKLKRDFYLRPTLEVARDLVGKFLVYDTGRHLLSARLVEVEAYVGEDDPACHAAVGRTERNEVMYRRGGYSYIYFIYGMYYCLNVVTEKEGFPAAVLIRGAEPVDGIEIMKKRYANPDSNKLTNGPGKLCKAFALTREHNGLDLEGEHLYLEDRGYRPAEIATSRRIGIIRAVDKRWRFFEPASAFVSVRSVR